MSLAPSLYSLKADYSLGIVNTVLSIYSIQNYCNLDILHGNSGFSNTKVEAARPSQALGLEGT